VTSSVWSSGQSSWLKIQKSGFDSRCCQIFGEVVGLERCPLSLVSTTVCSKKATSGPLVQTVGYLLRLFTLLSLHVAAFGGW
jgi:hypothetical protein